MSVFLERSLQMIPKCSGPNLSSSCQQINALLSTGLFNFPGKVASIKQFILGLSAVGPLNFGSCVFLSVAA